MKTRYWLLIVAGAFGLGWSTGRVSTGGKEQVAQEDPGRRPSADRPRENGVSATRWAEKITDRDFKEVAELLKSMAANERGPAIEAWVKSHGAGGLDNNGWLKLGKLLDAWAAEDFDGACRWAENVRDPVMREMGISGLAGAISEADPHRAFELFITNGDFNQGIHDGRLMTMMSRLSAEAAAKGPEALFALWEKVPHSKETVNSMRGVGLTVNEGADFPAMLNAMAKVKQEEKVAGTDRPVFLYGVMEQWAKKDPAAATDYLMSRARDDNGYIQSEFEELQSVIRKGEGAEAADRWTVDLLKGLSADEQGKFLVKAALLNPPEKIPDLMKRWGTPEETDRLIASAMQASVDLDEGRDVTLVLRALPMERRLEFVSSLRGVKDFTRIRDDLRSWKIDESRIAEIESAVKAPRE